MPFELRRPHNLCLRLELADFNFSTEYPYIRQRPLLENLRTSGYFLLLSTCMNPVGGMSIKRWLTSSSATLMFDSSVGFKPVGFARLYQPHNSI